MCNSVSIITPSFNQGKFIERTIKSVLMQNIPNLEYWIIDGASTDETIDVLDRYGDHLRWLSEKDNGQSDAVNKGLKRTSGDIIGWLNSDDIYYPNAIKKAYDFFEQNPTIDVVYGDAYHIDANDEIIESYPVEEWNVDRLTDVCFLCQPAVFFRRRIIDKFGMLNANLQYCMDYEYWLRLALGGAKFAHMPALLAGSRLHVATKTIGSRVKVHYEINDMFRNVLGKVPNRWLSNYAHVKVEKMSTLKKSPLKFTLSVGLLTIYASLKWNKTINKSLFLMCVRWVTQAIRKK